MENARPTPFSTTDSAQDRFLLTLQPSAGAQALNPVHVDGAMITALVEQVVGRLGAKVSAGVGVPVVSQALRGIAVAARGWAGSSNRTALVQNVVPALAKVLNERISFKPSLRTLTFHCFEKIVKAMEVPPKEKKLREEIMEQWSHGLIHQYVTQLRADLAKLQGTFTLVTALNLAARWYRASACDAKAEAGAAINIVFRPENKQVSTGGHAPVVTQYISRPRTPPRPPAPVDSGYTSSPWFRGAIGSGFGLDLLRSHYQNLSSWFTRSGR